MKGQLKERTQHQSTDHSDNETNEKTVLASVPSAVPRGPCDLPRSIKGFCSWGHTSPYLNDLKTKRFVKKKKCHVEAAL